MSEHKTIGEALLAFHKNPPHIALDATNPHFRSKFASYLGVTNAIRPRLAEEGLVFAQPLTNIDGQPALKTILIHAASGERIEEVTPLLLGGKSDPQSHGSAITYGKRYGLLSVCGLVGDEDDDGHAATRTNGTPSQTSAASPRQAEARGGGTEGSLAASPPDSGIPFGAPDDVSVAQQTFTAPGAEMITDPQTRMLNRLVNLLVKSEALTVENLRKGMDESYGVTSKKDLTKKDAIDLISRLKTLANED